MIYDSQGGLDEMYVEKMLKEHYADLLHLRGPAQKANDFFAKINSAIKRANSWVEEMRRSGVKYGGVKAVLLYKEDPLFLNRLFYLLTPHEAASVLEQALDTSFGMQMHVFKSAYDIFSADEKKFNALVLRNHQLFDDFIFDLAIDNPFDLKYLRFYIRYSKAVTQHTFGTNLFMRFAQVMQRGWPDMVELMYEALGSIEGGKLSLTGPLRFILPEQAEKIVFQFALLGSGLFLVRANDPMVWPQGAGSLKSLQDCRENFKFALLASHKSFLSHGFFKSKMTLCLEKSYAAHPKLFAALCQRALCQGKLGGNQLGKEIIDRLAKAKILRQLDDAEIKKYLGEHPQSACLACKK